MYIVDENKEEENIMEQGYEAKWAKFLHEAQSVDFEVLKKYLKQETNELDEEVDYYLESIKRDFNAGGSRESDYNDYEMDDYVEDFENYIQDKKDS